MKQFLILICALLPFLVNGQTESNFNIDSCFTGSGEIYFYTYLESAEQIQKVSATVSIAKIEGLKLFATANRNEFSNFLMMNLEYVVLPNPGDLYLNPNMLEWSDIKKLRDWDTYPTYETYVNMMYQFATDHPEICQVFSIGNSVNGRELLMAKISDNIAVKEAEPQFLYNGQMHGDEIVTYILLLRLIDHLLENYGTDPRITNLIDHIEIWINPLANPDGTYYSGNNTVTGARRYNANSVNLNRNFPDPQDGPHPDGNDWQPETIHFMQLAEANNFVMSANLHSGAEVVNYPWDTWPQLAADDDWWIYVSRQYADTVHSYCVPGYLNDLQNGITNGYAWYTINGGRQDYMNYFHHCRESTLELSAVKMLNASLLPAHWEYNYRSLLNYIEQCLYGVSGIVTDSISGKPLVAKIEIVGHDMDESFVYTDSTNGNYHRLLYEGPYDISFSAPGYYPKTIPGVNVTSMSATTLDVQLYSGELSADFAASQTNITAGTTVDFSDLSFGSPSNWSWVFEGGIPQTSSQKNPTDISYPNEGSFDVSLVVYNAQGDSSYISKADFITVSTEYFMQNGLVETCSGLFYDSGGPDNNYANNQDFIMTFYPGSPDAKISFTFIEFNLEYQNTCNYDWLKVYDGTSTSSPLIGQYCGTTSPGAIAASGIDGALTFEFHSDYSETRPGWVAQISCIHQQTINLEEGWNGISAYLQAQNPEIENMLFDIMTELIILQNQQGMFWPEQNLNTLVNWDNQTGYMIKVNNAIDLHITGSPVANKTIDLAQGWNLMPVISSCPVQISQLLVGTSDEIIIIKEIAGMNVYWPGANIFSLEILLPGKAYFIKATSPVSITFFGCE